VLIGYARVSTEDQNLDLQRDALTRAGCERIFSDKLSGARDGRPGLADALSHARAGDVLVVWKLDRLGRRTRSLLDLIDDLGRREVGFRSIDGGTPIDTTTAHGKFIFTLLSALAEMERDLIRERTNAGLAAARARGRSGGRRPKLVPKRIEHARRLLADRSTTITEVAASLGVDRTTLWRALSRDRIKV